jgi:hypothetical protein
VRIASPSRVEAVREGLKPAEEPPPARLELRSRDIVRVSWTDDGAAVLFDENGRKAIEEFTAANLEGSGWWRSTACPRRRARR